MHVNIYRSVADVTTTACKHSFHTFCLVETLGNGMCTSCPLCRTEVLMCMYISVCMYVYGDPGQWHVHVVPLGRTEVLSLVPGDLLAVCVGVWVCGWVAGGGGRACVRT